MRELSLDQLRAGLSLNESSVRTLEHLTMRATHEKEATFKLGSRYPIINASFAPVFNNAAIAQVIGNNSFTAPFPSFNYEDLGLTVKVKPSVHGTSDVSMQLEILFRTLGGASLNGVPVISNREYKAGIALKEGEPAVVAGMMTNNDAWSLRVLVEALVLGEAGADAHRCAQRIEGVDLVAGNARDLQVEGVGTEIDGGDGSGVAHDASGVSINFSNRCLGKMQVSPSSMSGSSKRLKAQSLMVSSAPSKNMPRRANSASRSRLGMLPCRAIMRSRTAA